MAGPGHYGWRFWEMFTYDNQLCLRSPWHNQRLMIGQDTDAAIVSPGQLSVGTTCPHGNGCPSPACSCGIYYFPDSDIFAYNVTFTANSIRVNIPGEHPTIVASLGYVEGHTEPDPLEKGAMRSARFHVIAMLSESQQVVKALQRDYPDCPVLPLTYAVVNELRTVVNSQ